MRSYECAVIYKPGLGDDVIKAGTSKYAAVIEANGGENTKLETWGKRRLAYEIDDHVEGVYFFMRFRAPNAVLDELGRQMKIDEEIIRHMICVDELATGDEAKIEAALLTPSERQEREEY